MNGQSRSHSEVARTPKRARLEPFRNPVTGEEAVAEIHNKNGFIWKSAVVAKTNMMRIVSPNLTFDESGKNAFFAGVLNFKGP